MNNKQNLEITKVFEEKGEYSRVQISQNLFGMIRQSNWAYTNKVAPLLNFVSRKNTKDQYIKIFNLNGKELYIYQYQVEDPTSDTGKRNRTKFFVKTADITEDVMVDEPVVDLDVDIFGDDEDSDDDAGNENTKA